VKGVPVPSEYRPSGWQPRWDFDLVQLLVVALAVQPVGDLEPLHVLLVSTDLVVVVRHVHGAVSSVERTQRPLYIEQIASKSSGWCRFEFSILHWWIVSADKPFVTGRFNVFLVVGRIIFIPVVPVNDVETGPGDLQTAMTSNWRCQKVSQDECQAGFANIGGKKIVKRVRVHSNKLIKAALEPTNNTQKIAKF